MRGRFLMSASLPPVGLCPREERIALRGKISGMDRPAACTRGGEGEA